MINYDKLFMILRVEGIKKTELLKIISPNSLSKISKGKNVETNIINKICKYLQVQPGDIMKYEEIDSIEIINKEDEAYKKGYRQRIIVNIPPSMHDYNLISKKVYENTDEIINEKIEIPSTFVREEIIL